MRRTLSTALIALCVLLITATNALAGDPSRIGDNVESIVSPNIKAFWKIGVVVGVVVFLYSRKINLLGVFLVVAVLTGMIIYDPAGFGETVSGVAKKVL